MNMLGNSLEEIAFEKAGIIKENIPVVIGETVKETKSIFLNVASECNAPIFFAEDEFSVADYKLENKNLAATYVNKAGESTSIKSDLPGIYQVQNIRTVLTAVNVLQKAGWPFEKQTVVAALQQVKKTTGLMGRWDVIQQLPTIVLDVAHNKEGIEKMLQHLQQLSYGKLHLVIGMVKDKDVEQVLQLLPKEAQYYFTQAQIPRALPSKELQQKATKIGLKGNGFNDVNEALRSAIGQATEEDIILVCGSIFLVAEVDKEKLISKTLLRPNA